MGLSRGGAPRLARPEPPRLGPGDPAGGDDRLRRGRRVRLPRRVLRAAERRVDHTPTSPRWTSTGSTRSPGRSRSRAPSRATRSRSTCSSSSPPTGAGPPRSRASGCWPTTSPTRLQGDAPRGRRRPGGVLARHPDPAGAVLRRDRRGAHGGPAVDDPARRPRRQHGHPPPRRRLDAVPARLPARGAPVGGRRPRDAGRRRGLGDGDRDADARPMRLTVRKDLHVTRRSSSRRPIRTPRCATARATRPTASGRTSWSRRATRSGG